MLTVGQLTAEHLVDPLGLDVAAPRLSWVVASDRRGARQTAYRIVVTGDREWDSGRVASGRTTDILYGGPPLEPEDRCRWSVEVEDDAGGSASSAVARFERMPQDWTGTWICLPPPMDAHDANRPCVQVRHAFELFDDVAAARLHVTAGGLIQPWLNGDRVGDDHLGPGWTDYSKRVRCRSFDVTEQIRVGGNALGAVIGDGWYAGRIGWEGARAHYGRIPVGRMELVVHMNRGEEIRIGTDHTWKARFGPVRAGDLLGGEVYDQRDALGGWVEASFDDSEWEHAWPDPGPHGALVASPAEPVRVVAEIPARLGPSKPGSWLADAGEVVAGWPRLTVRGAPGQIVRMRCAEVLDGAAEGDGPPLSRGELYTANLRGAQCTDTLTLAGGEVTYEPWSTFRGFRFVEITGAEPVAVDAVAVTTDARPTGDFACSSELLNDIWNAARRTSRNLRIGLPTDCVQRDERLGWLADADIGFATANYLSDLGNFYGGWLQEVRDAQSDEGAFPDVAPRLVRTDDGAPGWGDAGVLVPWALWEWYADRQVLEDSAESMAAWPRWVLSANPDFRWGEGRGADFGDWLAPRESAPPEVIAQAYWARSAALAAAAQRVLGRRDAEMDELAARVRDAFVADFVDPTGRVAGGSQTAQLLALAFDLVPAELIGAARRHLVSDVEAHGLGTGFLGARHLLPALTEAGKVELAYGVALSERPPGWGHMIRSGATTIWERWDSWTPDDGFANPYMNSFCHSSFGTVAEWLHSTVGGLARHPSQPGWTRAVVRPRPGGGVSWGRTSYDSRIGRWAVEWSLDGDRLSLEVEVPCGGEASVHLPGEEIRTVPSGSWSFVGRQENA